MMKTNRTLILIFILSFILLLGALYRAWLADSIIDCRADFSITRDNSAEFSGTADFDFNELNGNLKLLGTIGGPDGAIISRTVFFTYSKKGDTYLLKSEQVVKSASDNADDQTVKKFFPAAYTEADKLVSRKFKRYKGGFLISFVGLPVAYCKQAD